MGDSVKQAFSSAFSSVKSAFLLCPKALKLFYVLLGFHVTVNIVNLLVIPPPVEAGMSAARSFLIVILTVLFIGLYIFIYSGAIAYIRDLIKTGTANLASFINNGKKYSLRFLGVSAITAAAFTIYGFLARTIVALLPGLVKLPAVLIVILAGIALLILFLMPVYALIASDLGVIASVRKGILTGKNNFLKILLLLLMIFVLSVVVMIGASIITGIFTLLLRPVARFITALTMAVVHAFLIGVLTSIAYMDCYLKSEGTQ